MNRPNGIDMGVFAVTLLLLGCGLVFVYSSSFALAQARFGGADFFLARQAVRTLLALACFLVFINVDYHVWGKVGHMAFLGAVLLLIAVLMIPDQGAIKGAKRWIALGPLTFQVSDFARVALIAALAKKLDEIGSRITEWKVFLQQLVKIGIICGLVFLEPNLSTALIIAGIGMAMVFIAGARLGHIALVGAALIPGIIAGVLTTPYRLKRVIAFLDPSKHRDQTGYQTFQSLIGLGNGGVLGRGLGNGEQKFFYLPEPHTDFVFSILGEELGFVGLMIVLAAFAFLVYRGIKITLRAPDTLGQTMAFGITFMLAFYVVLHAFVNTGLVPTTGVPLPFLSYGGMSLVFTMCAMGILLNISSHAGQALQERPVARKPKGKAAWRV